MIPTLKAFMAVHKLPEVVPVADAGMISEANWKAIEAEGLSFILGAKMPHLPYCVKAWCEANPEAAYADGQVFVQREPVGTGKKNRADHITYYQWRADRARRTLRGIAEQERKAQDMVTGKTSVKKHKYVKVTGAKKQVHTELIAKHKELAGFKAYLTNVPNPTPEKVISSYSRLFEIEKSFKMAKSDVGAQPVFHRLRDSIEAHLTIVFAAMAVGRWIEAATGWSIRKHVRTLRRFKTITINAHGQMIEAADPIPPDIQTAIQEIRKRANVSAH